MRVRYLDLVMALVFLLLVAAGIALFFIRDKLMPPTVGHELHKGPTTSSPLIIPDQFVVLINQSHVKKLADILSPLALEVKYPLLNWIVVGRKNASVIPVPQQSDQASTARLTVDALLSHPLVLDAHHNFLLEPTSQKWSAPAEWQINHATATSPFTLALDDAWQITQGSQDVRIAVVDKFSANHQFTFAMNFPGCSARVNYFAPLVGSREHSVVEVTPHGEPLLQALGACNHVRPFSTGVDSKASIIAAEPPILGHAEVFLTALLASGIDVCKQSIIPCPEGVTLPFATQKPDVLLLPLGNNAPELMQISADMTDAMKTSGVIVVTSAGNDQSNANSFFPGASPHVINAAALSRDGHRALFSNWGRAVDIVAPGEGIEIAYPNGQKKISGTSIAAAYVAGTIALMKSVRRELYFEEARQVLMASASIMSCDQYCDQNEQCNEQCCDQESGNCNSLALNPRAALHLLASQPPTARLLLQQSYYLYLRDEPAGKTVTISNIGNDSAEITINAFDEHADVTPKTFVLDAASSEKSSQPVTISFKREPYKRQIFKFTVTARKNSKIVDRTEFFMEYIPKR